MDNVHKPLTLIEPIHLFIFTGPVSFHLKIISAFYFMVFILPHRELTSFTLQVQSDSGHSVPFLIERRG
jgi:hypothetical protein